MKKMKGFTLSEILVALLVLGIIVAASVPVIMNLTPNKNAIMIKKAYYATESIIHSLINDENYYPDMTANCSAGSASTGTGGCFYGFDDSDTHAFVQNPIPKGSELSVIEVWGEKKMRCLFASKLNIKEYLYDVCKESTTTINTMDGMTWDLSGLANTTENYVRVDVDGVSKGINKFYVNSSTCDNIFKWNGSAACGERDEKTKKKFDRIIIKVTRDGRLSIPGNQDEFENIISGNKKLIGGD